MSRAERRAGDGSGEAVRPWPVGAEGAIVPQRTAEFTERRAGGALSCSLCYRQCTIERGEAGWCRTRRNEGGVMMLPAHGVLSCAVRQIRGYQVDPFLTYKPGALSLFLGGVSCTSHCSFCMSKEIVWRPDTVGWGANGEMGVGSDGGWYGHRAVLHPIAAVELAQRWSCSQIEFGINEPTLTYEYTFDVATLAHKAGLDVVIESNGFTSRLPIRRLAPHVDAVDVGIKGSGEPEFYATQMRSPGAMDAVRAAMIEWRRAGVHLIVAMSSRHHRCRTTGRPRRRNTGCTGGSLTGWVRTPTC